MELSPAEVLARYPPHRDTTPSLLTSRVSVAPTALALRYDQIIEGRGGATAGEAEEGAKDGDLGAHGCHYVQH